MHKASCIIHSSDTVTKYVVDTASNEFHTFKCVEFRLVTTRRIGHEVQWY
jgi:hypothetical protein